jgi:simple sugar transport system ATP-binding protein
LLELRGISKRYPAVLANDSIDLVVRAGEIQALLGENGAGKSTLVKIIYGLVVPDSGEMLWNGAPVEGNDPRRARARGIGMVFQHFTLFETLTVEENIALGLDDPRQRHDLAGKIARLAARYRLAIDRTAPVWSLSVGQRQRVEIIRCLLQDPKLLILDEPTSVLTPPEAEALFETLQELAREGRAVLYISHKLEEIRRLCQSATVLRQGRVVARCDPRAETADSLARMMIGEVPRPLEHRPHRPGPPALVVDGLDLPADDPHGTALRGIRFTLHQGEILGIAGVAGNGQRELLRALSGEDRRVPREAIRLGDRPVGELGPDARRRLGLAFVPEERLGRGAAPAMSLAENVLLTADPAAVTRLGLIRTRAAAEIAGRVIDRYKVAAPGPWAEAQSLSGGNLQKFIVGRELQGPPRVLLAATPTWGVDVGAAILIRKALLELREQDGAVLLVSEDLDELLELADRVAVLFHGRLSEPVAAASLTLEQLGLRMGGAAA